EPTSDAPRVALTGEIDAAGGLCDLIAFLHQSQWSGALHTVDGATHRTVWFKRGDVRTCGSNLPTDRLGELLYRFGRVSRAELAYFREKIPSAQAIPVRKSGGPSSPPEEEHARIVLELCDGQRTVFEIARESKLGEFDATHALYQLIQASKIEIKHEWDVSHS